MNTNDNDVTLIKKAGGTVECRVCGLHFVPGLVEDKELHEGFTAELEQTLISSYLRRSRRATAVETHRHYIDTLLDGWLDQQLRIPTKGFLRRASPKEFLSKHVKEHLKSNSFRVSRVYPGKRGLVLLDGLNLEANEETVRVRAQEIGYAYYAMASVRDVLKSAERKDLVRASVVFSPALMRQNPKLEYAVESVKRDSDLVVDPTSEKQRAELAKTPAANRCILPFRPCQSRSSALPSKTWPLKVVDLVVMLWRRVSQQSWSPSQKLAGKKPAVFRPMARSPASAKGSTSVGSPWVVVGRSVFCVCVVVGVGPVIFRCRG